MVVSKLKDLEGKQTGCKLGNLKHNIGVGQIVKLGRIEYFVSEINLGGKNLLAHSKHKISNCNRNIL